MILSETPVSPRELRRAAPRFQRTLETPLNNLQRFVTTIASAGGLQGGRLGIHRAIFEPTHLIRLLSGYSERPENPYSLSLVASGQKEVESLLHAAFSDWLDFMFVPTPRKFILYADHDEYTTFYAHKCSNLNLVVAPLLDAGFRLVQDYQRRL